MGYFMYMHLNTPPSKLITELSERLDQLQAGDAPIQTHPLGFLRLALDGQTNAEPGMFLHTWLPDLPTQRGGPFIHCHNFHLQSLVLLGEVIDAQYDPVDDENGDFLLVDAHCGQESCMPTQSRKRSRLDKTQERVVVAGELYEVPKGAFHTTNITAGREAMTLINKSNVDRHDPILAIPTHIEIPREEFSRSQINQAFAWKKIRSLLSSVSL